MPNGKLIIAKWTIPAGSTAATASLERQSRNIRSMKFMTVHEAVETNRGTASNKTSRPPQGRDHQFVCS
jgi:hypothetical protein